MFQDKSEPEDSTAVIPTGRQIAISRLTGRGGSLFRFNPGTDFAAQSKALLGNNVNLNDDFSWESGK